MSGLGLSNNQKLQKSPSDKAPKARGGSSQGGGLIWLLVLALAAMTVAVGAVIKGKSYIPIAFLLAIYSMIPFFASFESRRPQARELSALAVMCALAVASRAAFIWFPNFKPLAGMVMITGIAFGASGGFLCGALSALISNFIFGQGPWTPFQMLTFGIGGFIFGLLSDKGIIPKEDLSTKQIIALSLGGYLYIQFIGGPILDLCATLFIFSAPNLEAVVGIFLAGIPISTLHGAATFLTLLLLGNPILSKLGRLRKKYGIMRERTL